ncbi:hypothetical protein ACFLRX_04810 [Acidobacteriota bacterium]
MRKSALVVLILTLASYTSAQTLFQSSLDEAMARAKAENKKIIVDFYSDT